MSEEKISISQDSEKNVNSNSENRTKQDKKQQPPLNTNDNSNNTLEPQVTGLVSHLDTENIEKEYQLGKSYFSGDEVEVDYKLAFQHFELAANLGHANAQYNLGQMYKKGLGVEEDCEKAIFWYKQAVNQGHVAANYKLGKMYFVGRSVEIDYDLGFPFYKYAADQGDRRAQCALGHCYKFGHGVEQDDDLSIMWYKKSADQNYVLANYNLGNAYYYGDGVEIDYKAAYKHYIAADDRNHEAYYIFGKEKFYDRTSEANYLIAYECFKIAANNGIKGAHFRLGTMYQFGYGVEKDEKMALQCYMKSFLEDSFAVICIAELYHAGNRETQDFSKALEWYEKPTVDINRSYALRGIGLLYEHGDGVEQDYKKAMDYYLQSAEIKNVAAYYNIAQLHYYGYGVEQSFTKALEWLFKLVKENIDDDSTHVYIQLKEEQECVNETCNTQKIYSIITEDMIYGKAHYLIGLMYNRGEGIDRDDRKAEQYFQAALQKGIEEAQSFLQKLDTLDFQNLSVTENSEEIKSSS